jgi:hypothetical protein
MVQRIFAKLGLTEIISFYYSPGVTPNPVKRQHMQVKEIKYA